MKKVLSIVLAALMLLSFTACGGKKTETTGTEKTTAEVTEAPQPLGATEDADAMDLHFTPPEGYDTVERVSGKTASGAVSEKSFTYTFADESSIMIGYTYGKDVTEAVPQKTYDEAPTATYAGKEFKVMEQGKAIIALCQEDQKIYGIGYSFSDTVDKAKFEALMNGISFTDATTTEENDDDMFGIRYDAKSAGEICATSVTVTEKADGTLVKKSINWNYGADNKEPDYRFLIRVYKNSTVEKEINADKEYEEVTINGVNYSARKAEEGKKPFEYFTQQGNDVYKIYNNGKSSGWGAERSEQSEAAFETFVNSISF